MAPQAPPSTQQHGALHAAGKNGYGSIPHPHEEQEGVTEARAAATAATEAPPPPPPLRRWIPGWAYLVLFVLLYSANNAVLAGLMHQGFPFTICNIMCVGNTVGVLTLFPVFYWQLTWKNIRKVTHTQWAWMLLGCLLANVLGSVAYLEGLRLTSVPARAMTGRLESVDFLAASAWFLGDRYGSWVKINALLTVLGVVTAILFPVLVQHHDPEGKIGYVYLVLGGWGYTLSLLITKKYLMQIPVGLLSLFKVSFGTILFHVLSVMQDGAMDTVMGLGMYPRQLWTTMLWYAPLFVTSTQVLWLRALKLCSPAVLSIGMNANFVVTVLWGILLLGKWPTPGELFGGGFILLSIVSGVVETVINVDEEEDNTVVEEGEKRRRKSRRKHKGRPHGGSDVRIVVPSDEEAGGFAAGDQRQEAERAMQEEEEEEEEEEEMYSSGTSEDGEETLLLKKPHFQRVHLEQDTLTGGFGPHVIM